MTTDTRLVPLFPLGIFLLPGESYPLHIFEMRYQELISECENCNISFGISFFNRGELTQYGSVVHLESITTRKENGFKDIVVRCEGVFEMKSFLRNYPGKSYSGGEIVQIPLTEFKLRPEVSKIFNNYNLNTGEHSKDPKSLIDIAQALDFNHYQKFRLVAAENLVNRERILIDEMKLKSIIRIQEKNSVHNFHLN